MQIILMCQHESGSVAFHAKFIDGIPAPERRYDIRNHQVILDNGLAEAILHHDAEELLRNSLYRLPTPAEQEAMAKASQQAMTVQEQEEYQELAEDLKEEEESQQATVPPAVQKPKRTYKKKAS